MLDTLTHENVRDFAQRYQGTIGWLLNDNGNKILVQISKVEDDKVTFNDVSGRKFYAYCDGKVQFEFLPVQRGWFYGCDGIMFLVSRRPARQWQRGISANNTTVHYATTDRPKLGTGYVGLEIFDSIFSVDQEQAYHCGKTAVWSKHFATLNGDLYLFDRHIGTYNDEKKIVTLNKNGTILRQEVMDMINRKNYKLDVLV